jgi:hypothetical protein
MEKEKVKYKGEFNWQGQCITLYTTSSNPDKALSNLLNKLSKKVGYSSHYVRNYFFNKNDKVELTRL